MNFNDSSFRNLEKKFTIEKVFFNKVHLEGFFLLLLIKQFLSVDFLMPALLALMNFRVLLIFFHLDALPGGSLQDGVSKLESVDSNELLWLSLYLWFHFDMLISIGVSEKYHL